MVYIFIPFNLFVILCKRYNLLRVHLDIGCLDYHDSDYQGSGVQKSNSQQLLQVRGDIAIFAVVFLQKEVVKIW